MRQLARLLGPPIYSGPKSNITNTSAKQVNYFMFPIADLRKAPTVIGYEKA